MSMMLIDAHLKPSADLKAVWDAIPHEDVHMSGEHGHYRITFVGEKSTGMKIIRPILDEGHCEVKLTCGY